MMTMTLMTKITRIIKATRIITPEERRRRRRTVILVTMMIMTVTPTTTTIIISTTKEIYAKDDLIRKRIQLNRQTLPINQKRLLSQLKRSATDQCVNAKPPSQDQVNDRKENQKRRKKWVCCWNVVESPGILREPRIREKDNIHQDLLCRANRQ